MWLMASNSNWIIRLYWITRQSLKGVLLLPRKKLLSVSRSVLESLILSSLKFSLPLVHVFNGLFEWPVEQICVFSLSITMQWYIWHLAQIGLQIIVSFYLFPWAIVQCIIMPVVFVLWSCMIFCPACVRHQTLNINFNFFLQNFPFLLSPKLTPVLLLLFATYFNFKFLVKLSNYCWSCFFFLLDIKPHLLYITCILNSLSWIGF